MGTSRFFVYVLAWPDGTPFYVGKGQKTRLFDHEREAEHGCRCDKCIVIRSIGENGGQMQRTINFTTSDEQVALAHEQALIRQYGHYGLCNKQHAVAVGKKPQSMLRLPEDLHADLNQMAEEQSRSLHNLIIVVLRDAVARWKKERQTA
jgi:hypothetical protein